MDTNVRNKWSVLTAAAVLAGAVVALGGCERSPTSADAALVHRDSTGRDAGSGAGGAAAMGSGAGARADAGGASGGQRSVMANEPTTPAVELIPTTISIDGLEVMLDVYAWRNLMPMVVEEGMPPESNGMLVRLALKPVAGGAGVTAMPPEGTDLSHVELRQRDKLWTGTPVNEGEPTAGVVRMVRGGPDWVGADGLMTVVVRVTAPDGRSLYVKAEGVVVEEVH